ncbi:biotin--[acetyl-CoA-carboxylase] ligase [Rhodococcus sp. 105337]|uniref:biotin--[acetyl-CoA-carboxylase] ligase n=1 Tax=Rhodococcus sp. 105337 TaxID=2725310 RepID=UPI00146B7697|nr:biotin--[acetyl-CoA-carboxylase] ligase [Rhodococcus sp. 105337]NME78364.1 biotin--[acetyl-CoA-carboxylase] ligase [Rhodococcus sp. 105337]
MAGNRKTPDLASLRAPLDVARLRSALTSAESGAFYTRLDVVDETGSTNADLLAVAGTGADRRALLAEFQSGGRGRHSRTWNGVPGAQVIVSVLLRLPGCPLRDLGWLPLIAGIATVDAVRSVGGVPAQLKWPNDVLVGGRKLAGILVEVASTSPEPVAVVGVGVNVTLTAEELPVPTATSLLLEDAGDLDRTLLAETLLAAFADRIRAWARAGWNTAGPAAAYRERCGTIGQQVRAVLPGDTELRGLAVDVDDQGRLVIRPDGAGDTVAVAAGDITHLRPA